MLFLMSMSPFTLAGKTTLTFKNFSTTATLEPLRDDIYKLQGSTLKVQVAPRLIVKVSNKIGNDQLLNAAPDTKRITDLFTLKENRYVLLHFSNRDRTFLALKELQIKSFVKLVQPDIQQNRLNAEENSARHLNPTHKLFPQYIELARRKGIWPGHGGTGVIVAIIDDGFVLQHPELSQLQKKFYYDFFNRKLATDFSDEFKGNHGTKVAGVIFGAHNGTPPEGLAPNAKFVGIGQADTWTSQTLQSFYLAYLAKADVINCSWHTQWLLEPVQDVVDELSTNGRNGKGTAVVFSAGNEGKLVAPYMHEASIQSAIVVGAKDSHGRHFRFSNFGDTVNTWAYGDVVTSIENSSGYTNFSGTSLAAAVTTGFIALILEKQPSIPLAELINQLQQALSE